MLSLIYPVIHGQMKSYIPGNKYSSDLPKMNYEIGGGVMK